MYNYEKEKEQLFTEFGYKEYLSKAQDFIRENKEFKTMDMIRYISGDSWQVLACIDYFVEQRKIYQIAKGSMAQYNMYRVY